MALNPSYAGILVTRSEVVVKHYQASFGEAEHERLEWHYWVLDTPQTVGIDRVYFPSDALEYIAPKKESAWKMRGAQLARELYKPGMKQINLAQLIHEQFKKDGTKNDRGKNNPAVESIERDVLKKAFWDELKKLS